MNKRFRWICILSMCLLWLGGCEGNYEIPEVQYSTQEETESNENPFEVTEDGIFGHVSHGVLNPDRDEEGKILPLKYEGGECSFEYSFLAEGNTSSIGFFMFLDGEPVCYRVDDSDVYSYCHSFDLSEMGESTAIFHFTPHLGMKGDNKSLTIVSITKPEFQPDMVSSSSYGFYHQALQNTYDLIFLEDAPSDIKDEINIGLLECIVDVSNSTNKITSSYIDDELPENGWNIEDIEGLNNQMVYTLYYNDEIVYDNLNVTKQDKISIRFTLAGMPGVEYGTSIFVNHQPVQNENILSYKTSLTKGNVWVLEATIDTSKLHDFNTFYVMAVPCMGKSGDAPIFKSNSILVYKEN